MTPTAGEVVLDVYVDPSCPWAWVTSRWLREVAPQRGLVLRWRSYSLEMRDGGELPAATPEEMRAVAAASRAAAHRVLRVLEALRAVLGEEPVDALYAAWGERAFVAGPPTAPAPDLLAECLRVCGLDPELEWLGDDPTWDDIIAASMEEAYAVVGRGAQTPTLVVADDPPRGLTGPVMSRAPSGQAAVDLWDAVRVLLDHPQFFELRRPRHMPFVFP